MDVELKLETLINVPKYKDYYLYLKNNIERDRDRERERERFVE